MTKLYASDLQELDTCPEQVYLFARTFPKGTTPTLANARKARTAGLDLRWLAIALTVGSPLQDAYDAAIKPARDAYDAAIKPARDAYDAALKPARDAYDAALKSALDAYDAALKPAYDAYDATVDEITVDLLVTIWP